MSTCQMCVLTSYYILWARMKCRWKSNMFYKSWNSWCFYSWAATCDFQQFDILTSVDSDKPVQPLFKLRNSKWCSFNSLTLIEYSSNKQRLWSDCTYVQADLRLCWSHMPHCWKSYALAQLEIEIFSRKRPTKVVSNDRPMRSFSNMSLTLLSQLCTHIS